VPPVLDLAPREREVLVRPEGRRRLAGYGATPGEFSPAVAPFPAAVFTQSCAPTLKGCCMHHALFYVECRRAHFWWDCDCCMVQGGDVRNARVVAGYVILLPKVTLTGKSWHRNWVRLGMITMSD